MSLPAPTDPLYSKQWYLQATYVPQVWDDYTGFGVHVGIFDPTGIDYSQPDIAGNADPDLNFVYNGSVVDPTMSATRDHSTALAGVISGMRNGTGIVGVAYDSQFTVVPVNLNDNDYNKAAMAYEAKFDVVNMSWNYQPFFEAPRYTFYQGIADGMKFAADTGRNGLGTVEVVSAGNDRKGDQFSNGNGDTNAAGPESNDRHAIVVAGAGTDQLVADYSNPGASLLVTAPAQGHWDNNSLAGIWTTDQVDTAGFNNMTSAAGGDNVEAVGTSFAAPQVAGIVALMLQANPNLGWRDVRDILALSALHIGSDIPVSSSTPQVLHGAEKYAWTINGATNWNGGGMHFSNDYGFGGVDALAAVRLAETWTLQQTSANEVGPGASFGTSAPITVPDNNSQGVTQTFSLSGGTSIETVTLDLGINHSFASDLSIYLTSPDGTESTLTNRTGNGIDLDGWKFESNAFMGEDSGGTWTLRIVDNAAGDVGTYSSATLGVFGAAATQDNTYVYTDEFGASGRIAVEGSRGVLNDSGGHDTINAAAVTTGSFINLAEGSTSTIAGRSLVINGTIEDAFGGDGDDYLLGNTQGNMLSGMRGLDILNGYGGNDTLRGGTGNDELFGGIGNDKLFGGADADYLNGEADNDRVYGEAGNDTLWGGAGNDILSGGFAHAAAARGIDGNDTVNGEGGNDVLIASYGTDVLDGGDGSDTLSFAWTKSNLSIDLGSGAASFRETGSFLETAPDGTVIGGGGWNAPVNITWKNMENLLGGFGDDTLKGDAGANRIDGGAGADTMIGGAGNDTYYVDKVGDKVSEAVGGGTDAVRALVSYALGAGQEVEKLLPATRVRPGPST